MATHTINNIILHTTYDNPSIGCRHLDWSCVDDNYDGAPDSGPQNIGYGRTEQEAIKDYLNNLDYAE